MTDVPLGEVLAGRYQVVSPLGRGGMGAVYKAIDLTLDRPVAVKIVPADATSRSDRQPFAREARMLARLSHPNILALYDIGEANGSWYLVTEFIQGRSLAEILREGEPLNPDYALEIIVQIGQAIAVMHQHGLIHRDIKPANVLVCDTGRALLVDFGLAVPFDDRTLTTAGTVLGTPKYMSPEQAMGLRLDNRSDIYSLAAVLYEALAGHPSSEDSASAAEILKHIVETPLPSIGQLNPKLPVAVSQILEKALAKNPDARYRNAEEFVRALRAAQSRDSGLPTGARTAVPDLENEAVSSLENAVEPEPGKDDETDIPLDGGPHRIGGSVDADDLHPTEAVAAYSSDKGRRLSKFAVMWNALSLETTIDKDQFVSAVRKLAHGLLREAVGYRIEQKIPYLKGTVGYMVEAPFLWIRVSRFPILFVAYDGQNADLLATVVQQLEIAKATEYFALLIVVPPRGRATGGEAQELNQIVADSVYRHDFVVLDQEHLARIIDENSSRALVEIILEQRIGMLAALSPYVVNGPVPDSMFFGRESQLKTISQSIARNNFAIVGGRRIGKSSILLRLRRLFGDSPRYRAIYIDCEARPDYESFFSTLHEYTNVQGDGDPSSFRRLAATLQEKSSSRMVVFLLDEIDELLDFDANRDPRGLLFKAFRAASQEGMCRFVFSGSRTLHRHLKDAQSPFFNFCEAITLGRLQDKSTAEIIRKPMQQLGFDMPNVERLVIRLTELTSSHPNIAQWTCDMLIKTSVGRQITVEALEQLAATPEFQDRYLSTAWGDATPHEKLISLLMEGPVFTDNELRNKLADYNVPPDHSAIQESLSVLCLYSLLEREGSGYRFALTQFPRIVRESGVVAAQVEWLASEVRSRCL